PDHWILGEQGPALHTNSGAKAMIRHHRLLYRDLIDPLDLLRRNRAEPTDLSRYWSYAGALHGHAERGQETSEYSELMATSQHFVAEQVLSAFAFRGVGSLLDVGGGSGAFLRAIGGAHPGPKLGLFDLPEVVAVARESLASELGEERVQTHGGNFFEDEIPTGYDLITLSRILHDHDDEPALKLLRNIRAALQPGKRLLIAEPLAGIRGAEGMGDAFFGLYLWAMGSGRPRRANEIHAMLREAGFSHSRTISTPQPVVASVIVASA
ncbi:MAG: methyltransferase, partial [Pseudomonadota bacterium]